MNIKIFLTRRRHIVGVGIKGPGYGIKITVIMILPGFLVHTVEEIQIPFNNLFLGLGPQFFVTFLLLVLILFLLLHKIKITGDNLTLENFSPAFPKISGTHGIFQLVRVGFKTLITVILKTGYEKLLGHLFHFLNPASEDFIAHIRQNNGAFEEVIINGRCKNREFVYIRLQQKAFLIIQLFQIKIKGGKGQAVTHHLVAEMDNRQLFTQDIANQFIAGGINDRRCIGFGN